MGVQGADLRVVEEIRGSDTAVVITPGLLSNTDLFESFDDDALDRVTSCASELECCRGDVLFYEGDASHHLYVVLDGRIAILSRADDGREWMFNVMEPGELFGEMGMLDDKGRSADARALEPARVLMVPYDVVRAELNQQPLLLWNLATLLVGRLRVVNAALADSLFLDVTGRTAKRLLELSEEADEFELSFTQEELAGMVGASRERVNKAIASFVRLGWLARIDGSYAVLNREQLRRRAE